jgi:hypothetical protein
MNVDVMICWKTGLGKHNRDGCSALLILKHLDTWILSLKRETCCLPISASISTEFCLRIGQEERSYHKDLIRGVEPLHLYDLRSTNTKRLIIRQTNGNASASSGKNLHPRSRLGPC